MTWSQNTTCKHFLVDVFLWAKALGFMPKTAVQLNILKIKASLAGFYGSRRNAHSKTSIRKTFPEKVAPEEKCWPHGKLPPAHHGKSAYFFQSEHSQRQTETDTYTERNAQKPTVDKPMHQYLFSHKCCHITLTL